MRIAILAPLAALVACGPTAVSDGDGGTAGTDAALSTCEGNARRCDGTVLQECRGGAFEVVEQCASACDPTFGCVTCQPGTGTCNGDVSTYCLPDGSGHAEERCDATLGLSCEPGTGRCEGTCSRAALGQSYIGCEYYPTVTAQLVSTAFAFAVAISNTSNLVATVTIDGGALTAPLTFDVAPSSVAVRELPWVPALKLCNSAAPLGCNTPSAFANAQVAGGAYRLRSTSPVTVYQFSPLDYTDGAGTFTYTNDASLLLPANALRDDYVAAAWGFWGGQFNYPGLVAVTATEDGTQVTVTSKVATAGTPSFPAGTPTSVTMNRGDVLQMLNLSGDLTGSRIGADKPIQVIAGHYCSNVPFDVVACDHLEESMFPVATLAADYLVTSPAVPPLPAGKEQIIRVIATEPATTLVFDPPVPGAATTLASAGDFVQIPRYVADFSVSADKKILVQQLMEGQAAGGNTGDPATTLAVPTEQYRTSYLFHAPTNYEVNYVNITAPTGATVMLDGAPITAFTPIGNTGHGVAKVQLTAGQAGDGNHIATSSDPFGIMVYGYGQYTSYFYPGGLDLGDIVID